LLEASRLAPPAKTQLHQQGKLGLQTRAVNVKLLRDFCHLLLHGDSYVIVLKHKLLISQVAKLHILSDAGHNRVERICSFSSRLVSS